MVGGDSSRKMAEASFRLSAWAADGTGELVAHGPTPVAALAAALNGVLAAAQAGGPAVAARGGLTVPVRAEGPSLAELVPALAASPLDHLDGAADAISGVSIDGLLRTDDGLTAWGFAAIAQGTAAVPVTLAVGGEPVVAETVEGVTI